MTKQEFLEKISNIVVTENNKRNNVLFSSVVIAQAILESGWGQSEKMMKANAVFGIKATKSWKGKVYNSKTKECYDGINLTETTACFRAYNSLEESVSDYFNLIIELSRYKKALNTSSARECIEEIKNGGYSTSTTYVENIMKIIEQNDLYKYDNKKEVIVTEEIKVGDQVIVLNNVQYNGKSFKKWYNVYDVIQVNGDRVVIGKGKIVTCAININNIRKV